MKLKETTLLIFTIINGIFAIPKPPKDLPVNMLLDGLAIHTDENGCCASCGYDWCPSIEECVRPWETNCQELDFPYNVLYQGGGIILPLQKKEKTIT